MWAIQAQVEYNTSDGWHGSKSTPMNPAPTTATLKASTEPMNKRVSTVVYGWDTTDPRNPGWYVEVRDYTGDTIDDSMKGGFPVDVDAYSEDDGTGASYLALALALRDAYPDASIIQGDGVRGFGDGRS